MWINGRVREREKKNINDIIPICKVYESSHKINGNVIKHQY